MKKLTPRAWFKSFPKRLQDIIPTHEPILDNTIEMTCKTFILFCLDVVEPESEEEKNLEEFYTWLTESVNPNFELYNT